MTLKYIAGIEKPDRGRILADGITLYDSEKKINLPPQERRVGLLFQNYALFPNMTVLQNIRMGAKREKDKRRRKASVQRTLDSHLRFLMEQEVREVIRSFGKTVLLVSHDRDEVFRMSDRIAAMNDGKIENCGSKSAVFADPKTKAGAMLTGCRNISRLEKRSETCVYAIDWGMELILDRAVGNAGYAGIRMHDICKGGGSNTFCCQVMEEIENSFSCVILLCPVGSRPGVSIGWEMDKGTWNSMRAERVSIRLPAESILLLEE